MSAEPASDWFANPLAAVDRLDAFFAGLRHEPDATRAVRRIYWWAEAAGVPRAPQVAALLWRAVQAPWFSARRVTATLARGLAGWHDQNGTPRRRLLLGAWAEALAAYDRRLAEPAPASDALPAEAARAVSLLASGAVWAGLGHAAPLPPGVGARAGGHPEVIEHVTVERLPRPLLHRRLAFVAAEEATYRATNAVAAGAAPPATFALFLAGAWPVGAVDEPDGARALVCFLPAAANCWWPRDVEAAERRERRLLWRQVLAGRFGHAESASIS